MNCTTRNVVTDDEVGVEPPAQAAVKALGAIDVRNRDDDDLELHVDRPRSRGLDCSFAAHLSIAHVGLLRFECLEMWRHERSKLGPRIRGAAQAQPRAPISDRLPQRPERGAELGGEELRLLPRGEVAAFVDLVEVDQVAIGAPGPCLRGAIALPRKDRDGHRERDLGGLLRAAKSTDCVRRTPSTAALTRSRCSSASRA